MERGPPQREGHVQGADRPGRPAARRPGAALPGQGPGLRRGRRRRRLDGGVRGQGLAAAAQGQAGASTPAGCCKPTVEAATYNGTLYAAPAASDGGMLYYRKDLVPTPPKTWDEMMGMCAIAKQNNIGCYAGQFSKYEGLTVNAAEAINTAGGTDRRTRRQDPDRRHPRGRDGPADPRRRLQARQHPQGGHHLPGGAGPPGVRRPASCCSCATGRTSTTWPTTEGSSKVKDKFGVAPLPGTDGRRRVHPGWPQRGDQRLLEAQGDRARLPEVHRVEESQKFFADAGLARAGARAKLYTDPALVAKYPYLPTLQDVDPERGPAPGHPVLPGASPRPSRTTPTRPSRARRPSSRR